MKIFVGANEEPFSPPSELSHCLSRLGAECAANCQPGPSSAQGTERRETAAEEAGKEAGSCSQEKLQVLSSTDDEAGTNIKDTREPSKPLVAVLLSDIGAAASSLLFCALGRLAFLYLRPGERPGHLAHLLAAARPRLLLCQGTPPDWLPGRWTALVEGAEYSLLQREAGEEERRLPMDLAYVVSTSGSTGAPKLVYVTRAAVRPNVTHLRERLGLSSGELIAVSSPFSFDPALLDVFLAAELGCDLLLLQTSSSNDPELWRQALLKHPPSFLQATPSLLKHLGQGLLRETLFSEQSRLRTLLVGGEAFPLAFLLGALKDTSRTKANLGIWNIYGVTELSVWASLCEWDWATEPALGQPFPETELRLAQDGELWLHSHTRLCFLENQLDGLAERRRTQDQGAHKVQVQGQLGEPRKNLELERRRVEVGTGDLGERAEDGSLRFVGRKAHAQLKRNGKRLHLAAISKVVESVEGVSDSLCLLSPSSGLVLFCRAALSSSSSVRSALASSALPSHAFPDRLHFSAAPFPLTAHGKTDARALLRSADPLPASRKRGTEDLEEILWEVHGQAASGDPFWGRPREERETVPLKDLSYFDSLTLVRFVRSMEEASGRELPQLYEELHRGASLSDIRLSLAKRAKLEPETGEQTGGAEPEPLVPLCQASRSSEPVTEAGGQAKLPSLPPRPSLASKWSWDSGRCVDGSVVLAGGSVFVGSHSGRVARLRVEDGTVEWLVEREAAGDRVEASVALSGDGEVLVVALYQGDVQLLRAADGARLGRFPCGGVRAAPRPVPGHALVLVADQERSLIAIDTARREEVWRAALEGTVSSRPALSEDASLIFVATIQGHLSCFNTTSGSLRWTRRLLSGVFGDLVVLPGSGLVVAPCVRGSLAFFDAQGEPKGRVDVGAELFKAPTVRRETDDQGRCVVHQACRSGRLVSLSLRCSPEGVAEEGRRETALDGACASRPFLLRGGEGDLLLLPIIDGTLLVLAEPLGQEACSEKTQRELPDKKDLKTQADFPDAASFQGPEPASLPEWSELCRLRLPGQVFSSPVWDEATGTLLLGCRDDRLHALGLRSSSE